MEYVKTLLTKISELTRDIETNYPELYQYLDENPITIPNESNPKIDSQELQNYGFFLALALFMASPI